jgi:hypothetical protein
VTAERKAVVDQSRLGSNIWGANMAAAAGVLRGYVIPGCSYEERAGGRSLRHLIIIITKLQELLQHTITITSPPVGISTS